MASTLQSDTPSVLGGPLVDLNGKVIGITVGGSGSGLQRHRVRDPDQHGARGRHADS